MSILNKRTEAFTVYIVIIVLLLLTSNNTLHAKMISLPKGLVPTPDVDQFFVVPDKTTVLTWKDTALSKKNAKVLNYTIRNYWFNTISNGRGKAKIDNNGLVTAYVKLPEGFYTITFPSKHERFGIISIPSFGTEYKHTDTFFSIDSGLSHSVKNFNSPGWPTVEYHDVREVREALIRVLKRTGISMARGRINWWNVVHLKPNEWQWETHWHYDSTRRAYQRIGVPMLGFFPKVPEYLMRPDHKSWSAYPTNMIGLAKMVEHAAHRWHGAWGAIELWNEPNFFEAGHPASLYATMIKTVVYAIHKHHPYIAVGGPALSIAPAAGFPTALRYTKYLAANGALDVMNFLSYHSYASSKAMQTQVSAWRETLSRTKRPNIPLYITESGRQWHISSKSKNKRPDQSVDENPASGGARKTAMDYAMRAIEAKACGVRRFFPFYYAFSGVLPHNNNWGMMGMQGTPLPQFAAYAQATFQLSNHKYIGDLRCDDPEIKGARVFAKGNDIVVVLYTGKVKHDATVKLSLEYNRISGIDGRKLTSNNSKQIPIPDGLTYIITTRTAVAGRLVTDTPAMRLYHMGHAPDAKKHAFASPIVLQFWPNRKVLKPMNGIYWVKSNTDNTTIKPKIRVINLSNKSHTVKIMLSRQHGNNILDFRNSTYLGSPQVVTVPAMKYKTITYPTIPVDQSLINLCIKATGNKSDLSKIQPLVVSIHSQVTLKSLLKHHPHHKELSIANVDNWKTQKMKCGLPHV